MEQQIWKHYKGEVMLDNLELSKAGLIFGPEIKVDGPNANVSRPTVKYWRHPEEPSSYLFRHGVSTKLFPKVHWCFIGALDSWNCMENCTFNSWETDWGNGGIGYLHFSSCLIKSSLVIPGIKEDFYPFVGKVESTNAKFIVSKQKSTPKKAGCSRNSIQSRKFSCGCLDARDMDKVNHQLGMRNSSSQVMKHGVISSDYLPKRQVGLYANLAQELRMYSREPKVSPLPAMLVDGERQISYQAPDEAQEESKKRLQALEGHESEEGLSSEGSESQ
ncbi:OLC1v1030948C1 [Oldenlandia corymbosa var. corymbosa]|uniref:OLC1v1030948C1 n=1 Tax=Oldenlandia corymbosa var. corymbosa TaxID=529605 RepID=A0AAV1CHA4_OLDCO|nr:OLC1v1030948C1 [Oldenlandia corymbosa var. corymbosa]